MFLVLAVFYVPKKLIGVIVVEDKAQGAKDAQAIAEAIAVRQQENWIENYPCFRKKERKFVR